MNTAIKKVLAAFLAPIAILGLVFTMFTASAIADGTTQQGSSGEQDLADQATSIVIDVRPWCGWTALTAADDVITLVPAAEQDTVYDGDAIDLEATGQQFAIRVGPAGSAVAAETTFEQLGVDNCSWFADDQINGVAVWTTLAGVAGVGAHAFVGVSDVEGADPSDTSMNFAAGSGPGEEFVIDNDDDGCAEDGFSFVNSPLTVTDNDTAEAGASVVTMDASSTTTNNFCAWTSSYAITIPADLKPLHGNSTYTFTGPTITNTMIYSRSED